MAIPIQVRCECGETHKANLGDVVECTCGRRFETSKISESNFPQVREHQAKSRLYVRIGAVFILATGLIAYFVWDFWAAAITVPLAGMMWFWYIRRWFMRRFVPSPGELPTVDLEASKE